MTLVNQTGEALRAIGDQVKNINEYISRIVETSREQASDISEINAAVVSMDQTTQQNTALVADTTKSILGLAADADGLVAKLAVFNVNDRSAPHPVARARPAAAAAKTVAPAQRTVRKAGGGGGASAAVAQEWDEF